MVYKKTKIIKQLIGLIKEFQDIWKDKGNLINILKIKWMDIPLIKNWQELYKSNQAKVYLIIKPDYKLINKEFNQIQKQKKLN